MNLSKGCAVRREGAGRRTRLVMVNRMDGNAAVRAVASAGALALLALTALSTLGGAQSTRRDTSRWARTVPILARAPGDTIAERRDERGADRADADSTRMI